MYDAIIIGAGASGLVCAINLARGGKSVAIIEAQKRGGKKILASGNGHCNIANANVSTKNFYGKNSKLIEEIVKVKPAQIIEFFNTLGLEIVTKDDAKMYPKSMQASIVLELLEAEIDRLNISKFYEVKELNIKRGFEVSFNNSTIKANNLIIATGSQAAPQLGGNSSGLEIAKNFNHTIIPQIPALVPLISSHPICKSLAGVKVKAKVRLFSNDKELSSQIGDFLFAKYGVSGLSILDLSLKANLALEKNRCHIIVDFFSDYSKQTLLEYLKSRIDKKRDLKLQLWLGAIINSKLSEYLLKELKLDEKSEAKLNSKLLKEIVEHFKNYRIEISGSREFKYAEVAYGGVDSREIDSKTMQSKKEKNLYFIGEVIDTVGDRGGYNFHFAWSSAVLCSSYCLGVPKSCVQ